VTGEETLSVEARLIADLGVQVARLTQQVAFRDMIITELKHEVKTERTAVVALLRESQRMYQMHRSPGAESLVRNLADIIERGDHRKETA
jgi:hypothetical protein